MLPDPTNQPVLPVAQEKSAAVPRYDFLDGLRAVLALCVVIHHAWYTASDYDSRSARPGMSHYWNLLAHGRYAVCFFIILSGFCLMLPVLKSDLKLSRGVWDFFKRRAWRILPPYYFAVAFAIILIALLIHNKTGTLWDDALPVTSHNVLTHLLLIHNFFPVDLSKINYVFWSISVEWQIYFFFPLLLLAWRFMGGIYTTAATLLFSILAEIGLGHFFHLDPRVHFLGLFALGMLAAYVSFSAQFKKMKWRLASLAALLAFGISLHFHQQMVKDLVFGCFSSLLLIAVFFNPQDWLHRSLNYRPLVFIGSFSYSLYLVHAPLLQILWQYPLSSLRAHPNVMCMTLILVGTPIIVLTSYLFFWCFERPFLPGKSRKQIHVKQASESRDFIRADELTQALRTDLLG